MSRWYQVTSGASGQKQIRVLLAPPPESSLNTSCLEPIGCARLSWPRSCTSMHSCLGETGLDIAVSQWIKEQTLFRNLSQFCRFCSRIEEEVNRDCIFFRSGKAVFPSPRIKIPAWAGTVWTGSFRLGTPCFVVWRTETSFILSHSYHLCDEDKKLRS